mmetsp:Transcript_22286/g.69787  ORF Transcript_22286/g.69787 Transcript_22286/m.69787 type:complete len:470 (+) Transcript_22286:110-1519(+)
MRLELRPTRASELSEIIALEAASYPDDEAASAATLEYRLSVAGAYFASVWVEGALGGFICGTRCAELTAASMSQHEAEGAILAIHSVVTARALRRRGVARRALREYADWARRDGTIRSMKLIAKAALLGLYRSVGFEIVGPSGIVHGREQWFECSMSTREVDMLQVDAFAADVFRGNPAAVVFTSRDNDAGWMQRVANENQLAETAFLEALPSANAFAIRWFTPTTEVALCGHATLAAAKALYVTGRADPTQPVRFETRTAGDLSVSPRAAWLEMDLPAAALLDADPPPRLLDALNLTPDQVLYCGRGPPTTPDLFLEIQPDAFASLAPDLAKLAEIDLARGLVVTARPLATTSDYAFLSRFFAPACGIPEDPVTGSAHALLTPYWESKLRPTPPPPNNEEEANPSSHAAPPTPPSPADRAPEPLLAYQASPRGGVLRCHTRRDRAIIQGQAVVVLRAKFRLDDGDDAC